MLRIWLLMAVLFAQLGRAQAPEPDGAGIEQGVAPPRWAASGPKCMEVPDWQVHEYNENFYIVRQSGCLDYEKPFLYLIFGRERALLVDTGSRNFPAAAMLERVVGKWLEREHRQTIEVDVVHSHAHSDHTWGDEQLRNLKSQSVQIHFVPATITGTERFYGMASWPGQGSVDLGGRVLDAIAIPGHSAVSVALYDRKTAVLLTGDSLYPGRLYVHDWDDFVRSTHRLVEFSKGKLVAHIFGCHVEQTETAFLDYPIGTIYQPQEHELALPKGDLLELDAALSGMAGPKRVAFRDFSIWPVPADSQLHGNAKDRFETREKDQAERKWNQEAPH